MNILFLSLNLVLYCKRGQNKRSCSCKVECQKMQITPRKLPLEISCINFSKTSDSIHKPSVWIIEVSYGIPPNMESVTLLCKKTEYSYDWFRMVTGVRQGYIRFPLLFAVAIDCVLCLATRGNRCIVWVEEAYLSDLDFDDDIGSL